MSEVLTTIAILCQVTGVNGISSYIVTAQKQLKCQQDYIQCVDAKSTNVISRDVSAQSLKKCVLEKKQ